MTKSAKIQPAKRDRRLTERVAKAQEELAQRGGGHMRALRDTEALTDKHADMRRQPFSLPRNRYFHIPGSPNWGSSS